jgi:hypothetical protein
MTFADWTMRMIDEHPVWLGAAMLWALVGWGAFCECMRLGRRS